MKRMVSLIIIVTLLISSMSAFADDIDELSVLNDELVADEVIIKEEHANLTKKFEKMSTRELNKYIDNIRRESLKLDKTTSNEIKSNEIKSNEVMSILPDIRPIIEAAWLAAAEIPKRKGYECAGTLIQYSVFNQDYNESGSGMIIDKIRVSSEYLNHIQSIPNPNLPTSELLTFTQGDLFYALHTVTLSTAAGYPYFYNHVYDLYDYDLELDYSSIFVTSVNNWAWLCGQTYVLNEVDVNLSFYN